MANKRAQIWLIWVLIVIAFVITVSAISYYSFFVISSSTSGKAIETYEKNLSPDSDSISLPPIPSTGKKHSIRIQDSGFSPPALRIEPGDTVFWTNHGEMTHTVTSDSGHELNSGDIDAGTGYYHTFNANGTYDYHCEKHKEMKGKIFVQV